jgi:hypothetical protein
MINNFLFYGIGLKSSELGSNPYWPFAVSASVELLAYIVTYYIVGRSCDKLINKDFLVQLIKFILKIDLVESFPIVLLYL